MAKTRKAELEAQRKVIDQELADIEQARWEKEESPVFEASVGKCYGVNTLKKKDGYLTMFKHLRRCDERSFETVEINIRKDYEGKVHSQTISHEEKFYYHAHNIGNVYEEIPEATFLKFYQQVRKETSV